MARKDKKRGSVPTVINRPQVDVPYRIPGTGLPPRSPIPEIDPMRNIVPGGAGPSREILEDLEREQAAKEAAALADPGPIIERPEVDVPYPSREDVPQVEEDPQMVEELGSIIDPSIAITRDAEPEFETTGEVETFETTVEPSPTDVADVPADDVYHVTFTKNLPDIQERGLNPFAEGVWRKNVVEEARPYQAEPSFFAFSDPEDALRWATKMQSGAGNIPSEEISILRLKGGDYWQEDPALKEDFKIPRSSRQTQRKIGPEDILDISPLPKGAGVNEEFLEKFPEGRVDEWLKYYGDQLRGLPQDEQWVHPKVLAGTWIEPDLSKRTPEDWRRSQEQTEEMVQEFGERGKENRERMIAELAEEERAAAAEKAAALADPGPVTYESQIHQRSDSDIENIRGHALADFKVTGGSPDSEVNQMISLMPRRRNYFKTIPFSGSLHSRKPDQNSFWYRGFPVHRVTVGDTGSDKYYRIYAPDNETLIFQGYTTEYTKPGTKYVPNHVLLYGRTEADIVKSRKVIKRIIDEYWTNYDKNTPDGALLTDPEKSIGEDYTKGQFEADMGALRLDEFLEAPHIGSVQQFHAGGFVEASTLSTASPFIV